SGKLGAFPADATLLAAVGHCDVLAGALAADKRERLDPVELARLQETVVGPGQQVELLCELAGRVEHVSSAGALWAARQSVIWWSFTHRYEIAPSVSWRRAEVAALEQAGVTF